MIFVGNDWAEDFHDVWVMDTDGGRLASVRFDEGIAGVGGFHELMAGLVDDPAQVVIGVETDRGLWVHALVASGYQVYAINPLSVARYRDRHRVSGAKSDPADAKVLADLVRTDRHNHRPVAADTALAEAVKVLARSHQNLIWERTRHTLRLRSALREFYPQALEAFRGSLAHPDALAVLGKAPTPEKGRRLTITQIQSVLKHAGRKRNVARRAEQIKTALRSTQLETDPLIADAYGTATGSAVAVIAALNTEIGRLETGLTDHFEQHPDAAIYLSQPGLGVVLGARVLAEFGDDPNRYGSVKSRRNYAGSSPITIKSGKHQTISARWIRNRRLISAVDQWAFSSLTPSPGARLFYDQHRANGDTHHQALRALANRLVGILHGCLKTRTLYDEHTAWAHRQPQPETKAA